MPDKLLKLPEVRAMVRRSTTRIYDDMNAGKFPRPVRIGVRAVAWLESDLQIWLAARIHDRDQREIAA